MVTVSGTVLIPGTCGYGRIAILTSCAKGFEEAISSLGSEATLQTNKKEETPTFTRLQVTALMCRMFPGRSQSHQALTAALMRHGG